MHARGGQADHGVARLDARAADEPAALGDADREARDVEVVGAVQVGHLGGLAAEQRAAGLAAAVGDALDELRDAIGIEPPTETQSRNSTGSAPQVMTSLTLIATRSMPSSCSLPGLALQERLRADGVGARGEHRVGELRGRDQPGEAAERAEHERRARRLDRGAQAVDDGVRRVERDARLGVGQRRELAHLTPRHLEAALVERGALGRDRVLAGQAGAAEAGRGPLDRELQALEAQVGERVGADHRADLVDLAARPRSAPRARPCRCP